MNLFIFIEVYKFHLPFWFNRITSYYREKSERLVNNGVVASDTNF